MNMAKKLIIYYSHEGGESAVAAWAKKCVG